MEAAGSQLCARARFWSSLRMDGELSELESALLDAHLARCSECSALAAGFAATTDSLRAAPLERVVVPVKVMGRRAPRRLLVGSMIAAVVALGAVAGGLVRGETSSTASSSSHIVAVVASMDTPDQLRRLRRTSLLNERQQPRDISAEPV
jgi:anti-sigma factor RsiW